MLRHARSSATAIVFVSLVAGLGGCRQPQVAPEGTWSDKWGEQLSSMTAQMNEKLKPQATEVPSPKPDERMAAGRLLEKNGDIDRAIGIYTEIVNDNNRRVDAHHRLALLYDLKGDHEAAMKHYQPAIKKHPKDAELLCDLGYHHYLAGEMDKAEATLKRALERQPASARAHNNLALVLVHNGRYDEALEEFIQAGNKPAAAHVNLAYTLIWEDRLEEAAAQINLALAADPSSKPAQQALASLSKLVDAVDRRQESETIQVGYEEGTR